MKELSRRVQALSPEQQKALLDRWASRPAAPVPTADAPPAGALSFAEERLWFLQAVAPDSAAYNVAVTAELFGKLDVDAMRTAATRVVERHDVLRTRFISDRGRPTRVIAPEPHHDFEVRVLEGERDGEARRLIQAEAWRPFVLHRDPLLRLRLLQVAPDRWMLALITHHIACDGWSLRLLVRDLWASYRELVDGTPANLPPIAAPFADFARRQRQQYASAPAHSIDHWRSELSRVSRVQWHTAANAGALDTRAVSHVAAIDSALLPGLARLAREEGATTFMLMAAALSVVVGRYADEDFLIGFPATNRLGEELEQVVGLFANTLVLRASPAAWQTGRELVALIRRRALDAFEHEMPFSTIVREARLGDSDVVAPLIQVMCVVDDAPIEAAAPPELDVRPFLVENRHPKFDLSLTMTRDRRGIRCAFELDLAVFTREDGPRLVRDLEAVLRQMASAPDLPLGSTPAGTPRPSRPATTADAGAPFEPMHDAIAGVARQRPHAEAILSADGPLTYAELQATVDRVAAFVRRTVPGSNGTVGVHLPRSVDAVVAVLAVLQAGCAYVPIGPGEPPARVEQIVRNAGCALVIAAGGATHTTRTISIADAIAKGADPAGAVTVSAGELAYIIHTSGTTGAPKGVMVSHGSLSASTRARLDAYDEQPGKFLWLSPLVFDSSVAGLFWTLSVGGSLVIPRDADLSDVSRLRRMIGETGPSHMLCLPSVYASILRSGTPEALASLRVVIVAGEPCPAELVEAHHQALRGAALYNEYGPTENTVWATVHRCRAQEDPPVPIGTPITGTYVRILDRAGRVVSRGAVGELYIGGGGLARGYADEPALTAARFVPDPSLPGARLYRTGDLASEREDGSLDFHGRVDRQVKVRGIRIDPGEIEAHLLAHDGVNAAAVVGQKAGSHTSLTAYIEPRAGASIGAGRLDAHLRTRLPDAFRPARYRIVAALPRMASGKVDLTALPLDPPQRETTHAASTESERAVAAAWAAVLGNDAIGVDENFFDIGGDSLRLMSLHAHLAERLPGLSAVDLLEHPTIAAQARLAEKGRAGEVDAPAPDQEPLRRLAEARRKRRGARLAID